MNKLIYVAIFTMLMSACQTVYVPKAREVKKKPKANGVIAMPSNYRPEDRTRADELMRQNCGASTFNILDEGEAVVGQETKSSANATNRDDSRQNVGSLFGIPVTSGQAGGVESNSSSVTTQLKEWQISYDCQTSEKPTTKAKR